MSRFDSNKHKKINTILVVTKKIVHLITKQISKSKIIYKMNISYLNNPQILL